MAILDDLRKLEEDIISTGSSISGELKIGASTIPGAYILPAMAADFKQKFPDTSFEILTGDSRTIANSVLSHELLIGIVGARMASSKLDYIPFLEDELVLVASAKRDIPSTISFDELRALPFILREEGSGTRKSMEIFLSQRNIGTRHLDVCATLGSSTAVKEAVKSDLGISIISRCAMQDELATGSLKEITINSLAMKRTFYIITSKKRTLPNHYQVFLNTILAAPAEE